MMSRSDATVFEELQRRVDALEARMAELEGRVDGKDVAEEVLGEPADPAKLKQRRQDLSDFRNATTAR